MKNIISKFIHFLKATFSANENGLEIKTSINIPFKEYSLEEMKTLLPAEKILAQFRKTIIRALEERMVACMQNLQSHLDSIYCCTPSLVGYMRKDGTYHQFNVPSYEGMQHAVQCLKDEHYEEFLNNTQYVDQTLKALYWIQWPEDQEFMYKKSDLISLLTECHMFGPRDQTHIDLEKHDHYEIWDHDDNLVVLQNVSKQQGHKFSMSELKHLVMVLGGPCDATREQIEHFFSNL